MTAGDLPAAFASLPPAWRALLRGWTTQAETTLVGAVKRASGSRPIGPDDPFRALRLVDPDRAVVVVFGQDPYPGAGHADGLAFSAPTGARPSLRRIFDVLEADRPGWKRPASGRLDRWARQGVLLLNPVLTVELGHTGSHSNVGWQALTSQIVESLCRIERPPAFLLWGAVAKRFFDSAKPASSAPLALRARHPSNDFGREFMADGSHFMATAALVDWWGL